MLMVAALFEHFPLRRALSYVIIYPASIFLVTAWSTSPYKLRKPNLAAALLADLQQANQKLQAYALQVQELAAANERNRLARELHDSVTQTIFGLTLSAQAARILLERDPS
jgi:signal transduction histidine kinase